MNASSIKPPNFTRCFLWPRFKRQSYTGVGGRFLCPCAPRLAFLTSLLSLESQDVSGSAASESGPSLSPAKKYSNLNRLVARPVARRGKTNGCIPCLKHGQEVSVVIGHVFPAHELDRQPQKRESNSQLVRGGATNAEVHRQRGKVPPTRDYECGSECAKPCVNATPMPPRPQKDQWPRSD